MFDAAQFSGFAPLFPLPNAVLFPGAALPLHVFEPRYRKMTEDALEGEKLIVLAGFEPGWEETYLGNPAVKPIACLGLIRNELRLPDGRYYFLLVGVSRVRIVGEVDQSPYRVARVELLRDGEGGADEEAEGLRQTLSSMIELVQKEFTKLPAEVLGVPLGKVPFGALADLLAAVLPFPQAQRQALLEELDPRARSKRLLEMWRESLEAHFQIARKVRAPRESPN